MLDSMETRRVPEARVKMAAIASSQGARKRDNLTAAESGPPIITASVLIFPRRWRAPGPHS